MGKGITWPDAPAGGPWHFPGIPGVYAKDVAVALESTGCSEDEMSAIIKAHPGCGLKIVELDESANPPQDVPKAKPRSRRKPTASKEA
jgi:hypothetical protein